MGLFCGFNDNYFYDSKSDPMWILSVSLLSLALTITTVTTVMAWLVSIVLTPTWRLWRAISALSALSAMIQVPVFLMFETKPCSDYKQDLTCTMSIGSFLLIASLACSVLVTLITQCLDPPDWTDGLDNWRVDKRETSVSSNSSQEETSGRRSRTLSPKRSRKSSSARDSIFRDIEEGADRNAVGNADSESPRWDQIEERNFPSHSIERRSAVEENVAFDEAADEAKALANNNTPTSQADKNAAYVRYAKQDPKERSDEISKRDSTSDLDKVKKALFSRSVPSVKSGTSEGREEVTTTNQRTAASAVDEDKKNRHKKKLAQSKGYALMDDDDIESSFPISPPPVGEITFQKMDPEDMGTSYRAANHHDDAFLLDDWDPVHYFDGPITLPTAATARYATLILTQENEESKQSSSFDEHGYVRDASLRPVDDDDIVARVMQNRSMRTRRRKKRKTKMRSSVGSIASSPSLLDTTIQEETPADLKESDAEEHAFDPYTDISLVRTHSAPNVREIGRVGALHSDGVTSYHIIDHEIRGADGMMLQLKHPSLAVDSGPGHKVPIFKEERVMRQGIHAAPSSELTEDSRSFASAPSHVVREARIQRLQQMNQQRDKVQTEDSSVDSDSNLLDSLDLQLVQVLRPDGVEYGPEEGSL